MQRLRMARSRFFYCGIVTWGNFAAAFSKVIMPDALFRDSCHLEVVVAILGKA